MTIPHDIRYLAVLLALGLAHAGSAAGAAEPESAASNPKPPIAAPKPYPNHTPVRGNYPGTYPKTTATPARESPTFDWVAAGIGATAMLGAVLLVVALRSRYLIARRRSADSVPLVLKVRNDSPGTRPSGVANNDLLLTRPQSGQLNSPLGTSRARRGRNTGARAEHPGGADTGAGGRRNVA